MLAEAAGGSSTKLRDIALSVRKPGATDGQTCICRILACRT